MLSTFVGVVSTASHPCGPQEASRRRADWQAGFTKFQHRLLVTTARENRNQGRLGLHSEPPFLCGGLSVAKLVAAGPKFERRSVCVVDGENAGGLEHGIHMQCVGCCRTHFTRSRATAMVDTGEAEWVGKGRNVLRYCSPMHWRKKVSAGGGWVGPTMQMVRGGAL